jgi:phosphoesterase RecJ-like protein
MNAGNGTVAELAPRILELVRSSKKILLHLHPRPDPDSIGSALAMFHALKRLGKETTIIQGDSQIPEEFLVLPGSSSILNKTFFEIDVREFDLFIILDSGNWEMVSNKDKVVFPKSLRSIVIDHHISNAHFAEINLVEVSASSTASVLFNLFEEWMLAITPDIAICLYVGIYYDTARFCTPLTTSKDFEIAAVLTKIAPDFYKTISAFDNSEPAKRLIAEALAISSTETFMSGRIAVAAVDYQTLLQHKIEISQLGKIPIAQKMRSVKEWDIVISLIEEQPNLVKISFRTKSEQYDLSKIATSLGGGGHKGAAAAILKGSISEVKKRILRTIETLYPQIETAKRST